MAILKSCLNDNIEIEIKITSRIEYSDEGIYNHFSLTYSYPNRCGLEEVTHITFNSEEFEYASTFVSFFEFITKKTYKQEGFKTFPEEDLVVIAYPFTNISKIEDKTDNKTITLIFSFTNQQGLIEKYNGPAFIITSNITDFETFVKTLITEYESIKIEDGYESYGTSKN